MLCGGGKWGASTCRRRTNPSFSTTNPLRAWLLSIRVLAEDFALSLYYFAPPERKGQGLSQLQPMIYIYIYRFGRRGEGLRCVVLVMCVVMCIMICACVRLRVMCVTRVYLEGTVHRQQTFSLKAVVLCLSLHLE